MLLPRCERSSATRIRVPRPEPSPGRCIARRRTCLLQAPPLPAEGRHGGGCRVLVQARRHHPQGREVPGHVRIEVAADRWDREGGGPPALAPHQQPAGIAGPRRVAEREASQAVTPGRGLGSQLGGAQRAEVDVDQVEPAGAGVQHVCGPPFGVGEDGAGQPRRRPGPDTARTARRGRPQMSYAGRPPAAGQREPAAQQVGLGDPRGVEGLEGRREARGRTQQAGGGVAGIEPALQQDELGPGRPPGTPLATERVEGLGAAGRGGRRVTGGGRRQGRGEQELAASGRRPVQPDAAFDRLVGHPEGVVVQLGREQDPHAGHVDVRLEDLELVDHLLGIVQQAERGRQVATGEGHGGPVVQRGGVLEALAARGEQLLAPGEVLVGPSHRPQSQVRRRPVAVRPRFPDRVTGAAEQVDRPLGGPEHLGVAAQQPQGVVQADLDAARRRPVGSRGCSLDLAQAARMPGHHEGDAVRRADVGATLRVAGPASAPEGGPELLERLVDVAEVAQHDARRLVGDRSGLRSDAVGQQGACSGERLVGLREGEGQQTRRGPAVPRGCAGLPSRI